MKNLLQYSIYFHHPPFSVETYHRLESTASLKIRSGSHFTIVNIGNAFIDLAAVCLDFQ